MSNLNKLITVNSWIINGIKQYIKDLKPNPRNEKENAWLIKEYS